MLLNIRPETTYMYKNVNLCSVVLLFSQVLKYGAFFISTDTANIMNSLRKSGFHFAANIMMPPSPEECTKAVVHGAATRERDVYFPHTTTMLCTMLRHWIPSIVEAFLKFSFTRD